jgi:predicted Zn-dependent protease
MLALLAAVITVWLGLVAHFGAAAAGGTAAGMPDQVGVVRVEAGEGLQQLAARVAPGAPTAQMVDRIRELNRLDSVVLDAGQTLIAPVD